jgi:hypothetical protein
MTAKLFIADSGGTTRLPVKIYIADSGATVHQVKLIYVADSGGTSRLVYNYFAPVTNTYVGTGTSVSGTETIPPGATNLTITVVGGGGSGAHYSGATSIGGGGGGGAAITGPFNVASSNGLTLNYTAGAYGAGLASPNNGLAGGGSTCSSGTLSITSMGANAGLGGTNTAGGTGGTASGGTTSNTTGGTGTLGAPGSGGASGDPASTYGGGGSANVSPVGAFNGQAGCVIFAYT